MPLWGMSGESASGTTESTVVSEERSWKNYAENGNFLPIDRVSVSFSTRRMAVETLGQAHSYGWARHRTLRGRQAGRHEAPPGMRLPVARARPLPRSSSTSCAVASRLRRWTSSRRALLTRPKVVRAALQNAASIAGHLITAETMVTGRPKKDVCRQPRSAHLGPGRRRCVCHHSRRSWRLWCTIIPAAMDATMTSRVVIMTLCRSRVPDSRAQRDFAVCEVAPDSDRLIHSAQQRGAPGSNAAASATSPEWQRVFGPENYPLARAIPVQSARRILGPFN
jgi:hypothetical protein